MTGRQRFIRLGRGFIEGYLVAAVVWFGIGSWLGLVSLVFGLGPFGFDLGPVNIFRVHAAPGSFAFEGGVGMALLSYGAVLLWALMRAGGFALRHD